MVTRIAIPVSGEEIAPRFSFAQRLLLVDLEEGQETGRALLEVGPLSWTAKLSLLAARHVTLLCCSGFNRAYLPFSQGLGIGVSWGHNGSVEQLLNRIREGEHPREQGPSRSEGAPEPHQRNPHPPERKP